MREILFRGKRIDNGKWIIGYYIVVDEISYILPERYFLNGIVQVEQNTVGQYTGVQDKNGTKIFEGDIVHAITANTSKNCLVKCEYGQFCIGLCMPLAYVRNYAKVIGNIHDNPELLEVK